MRTAEEGARKGAPQPEHLAARSGSQDLLDRITHWLDEAKAEAILSIDLKGKSSIGDFMVIATGRSDRHVGAIAEQLRRHLKEAGRTNVRIEGLQACDWVLIDTGDIVVHVFRPEVREFYNLEKMWLAERPGDASTH